MSQEKWTILFRDEQTGAKAMRLTPEGGLTRRKMFAVMIDTREEAEKIAAEIRENHPEATVRVEKF